MTLDRKSSSDTLRSVFLQQHPGSNSPVIDTTNVSFESFLKQFTVFAEVVKQSGDYSLLVGTKNTGILSGTFCNIAQMLR